MAKTEYVDLLPSQSDLYYRALVPTDRFAFARVTKKISFFSRKKKKGLTQRSLLPQLGQMWAALSSAQREAWSAAGAECNLNGWRLFVRDTCARIYNDLSGTATPSLLHQAFVGNLHIEAPANEIKIQQLHPGNYYVSRKVRGTKSLYQPVPITEALILPLEISLNYKANLVAVGAGAFAKFYARVWRSYQGRDYGQDLALDLDLSCNWQNAAATLAAVHGQYISYSLFFHLYNVRGDLYFDNLEANHSGQNWARDPFCQDILQGYTRAFYQIPQHWAAVTLPAGAHFDSVYLDF